MKENGETLKTSVAIIKNDMEHIKGALNDLKKAVNEVKKNTELNFVTKSEFQPVRQIAFGLVGLVLTAVIVALVSLVIR